VTIARESAWGGHVQASGGALRSINQTGQKLRLPNFCNLGVMLRALLLVNVLMVAAAGIAAESLAAWREALLTLAAVIEPALILSMLLLCALRVPLQRLPYASALLLVLVGEALLGVGFAHLIAWLIPSQPAPAALKAAFYFAFVTGLVLLYFDLHARALSPAVSEARLQALQARIRPHFLFNSINAVLSFIRSEPKRAEHALTDLAELFRVLMAENTALTTLAREVELTRQYLALESMRLGERLTVEWHVDAMPEDALVPPLILQPLAENAVYHGIEPLDTPGIVHIHIARNDKAVRIEVSNPVAGGARDHAGNRMAMANIRERLRLHFDAEASMRAAARDGVYRVSISIPYQTRD
jgi:two-component system sensor histidine kinase AlgZ